MQAYSFTSTPIAQAIAQAKDRGVTVTVVLDDSQRTEKYTGATYLLNRQVPVLIDAKRAIPECGAVAARAAALSGVK